MSQTETEPDYSGHALFSPSSAFRWKHCQRSLYIDEIYKDKLVYDNSAKATYASRTGTRIHAWAEHCIIKMLGGTSEYLEKPLTERMEKSLGGYLKDAQRVISDPNTDNYVEKLVVCNPYLYGTADRIDVTHYKNHKMLTVSDLKTGRHVVEPKDNEQLMLYAWMFIQNTLDEYEWNDYDVVRLRIYQNKKFTTWKANVYTIESRVHELLQVVIETGVYPDKSIKMGEWCQWCPARVLCDEQSKQLKTVEQLSKE